MEYDLISQYANCPPTRDENGLVGYWNFEEGPEQGQVLDLSGSDNGTINGASYNLDVSNQSCSSFSDSDEINVTFDICGCTDTNASNYNLKRLKMMVVANLWLKLI